MKLIIFTEEPSMKVALKVILAKLEIPKDRVKIIEYQGVGNLENALPRALRANNDPDTKFLVLRDNDSGDCKGRKAKLMRMAQDAGRINQTKVRIVCQGLEAWFIGDAEGLRASKHLLKPIPKRLQTCDPDHLPNPKKELKALRSGYNEIGGAKAIAPHIEVGRNRSTSFLLTIAAIRELTV